MDKRAILALLAETPEEARELGRWLTDYAEAAASANKNAAPSGLGPEGGTKAERPAKRTAADYFLLLSESIAAIWLLLGGTCLILLPLRRLAAEMAVSVNSLLAVMLTLAVLLLFKGKEVAAWLWPEPVRTEEFDEFDAFDDEREV